MRQLTEVQPGSGQPSAQWSVDPAAPEVGQPMQWSLTVQHPAGARVELVDPNWSPDDSWFVLERADRLTLGASAPSGAGPALESTVFRWSVASLEAGERELPEVPVQYDGGLIAIRPARVLVEGVLIAGEDAPRPHRGFDGVSAQPSATPWPAIAGASLLVLIALALWWRRRGARAAAPVPLPSASVRLAELERHSLDTAREVQDLHYAVTAILREELDRRVGQERSGLTDPEWVVAAGEAMAPTERASLAQVFERCEKVKYARQEPTAWAAREVLKTAREIAHRWEEARVEDQGRAA